MGGGGGGGGGGVWGGGAGGGGGGWGGGWGGGGGGGVAGVASAAGEGKKSAGNHWSVVSLLGALSISSSVPLRPPIVHAKLGRWWLTHTGRTNSNSNS